MAMPGPSKRSAPFMTIGSGKAATPSSRGTRTGSRGYNRSHALFKYRPSPPPKVQIFRDFLSPHVKKGSVFRCAKAKLVFIDCFSKSPVFLDYFSKSPSFKKAHGPLPPNESLSNRDWFASDCLHRQHSKSSAEYFRLIFLRKRSVPLSVPILAKVRSQWTGPYHPTEGGRHERSRAAETPLLNF